MIQISNILPEQPSEKAYLQSQRPLEPLAAKFALVLLLAVYEPLVPGQRPRVEIVLVANVADMWLAHLVVQLDVNRQSALAQQPLVANRTLMLGLVPEAHVHLVDVLPEVARSARTGEFLSAPVANLRTIYIVMGALHVRLQRDGIGKDLATLRAWYLLVVPLVRL